MILEVQRVAQELKNLQSRASHLAHHLYVLSCMQEGDRVRARFEFGGRIQEHVGVVRVMSESSFFLEIASGSLMLVEGAEYIEILASASLEVSRD